MIVLAFLNSEYFLKSGLNASIGLKAEFSRVNVCTISYMTYIHYASLSYTCIEAKRVILQQSTRLQQMSGMDQSILSEAKSK